MPFILFHRGRLFQHWHPLNQNRASAVRCNSFVRVLCQSSPNTKPAVPAPPKDLPANINFFRRPFFQSHFRRLFWVGDFFPLAVPKKNLFSSSTIFPGHLFFRRLIDARPKQKPSNPAWGDPLPGGVQLVRHHDPFFRACIFPLLFPLPGQT